MSAGDLNPAVRQYLAENGDAARRIAAMPEQHRAAALARVERWVAKIQPVTREEIPAEYLESPLVGSLK